MKNITPHHRQWLIIRHAKSSWSDPTLSDHKRPLNKRGKRDAKWIGEQLKQRDWCPQRIINSDATRVKQTFERIERVYPQHVEAEWRRDVYLCQPWTLLDIIGELPDDIQHILTLGHNPMCEMLIEELCGHDLRVTTANIIRLVCVADTWAEAIKKQWVCCDVLRPREPRSYD